MKPVRSCARACCLWPLYVALALAAYLGIEYLLLPDVRPLAQKDPADTALMRLRSKQALAKGRTAMKLQTWVALGSISPHLQHAVLVAEDDAFWDHPGYDLREIEKSIRIDWQRRKLARGASTITQQLAKNLYLSPSRNPVRKLKELVLALRLEKALGKKRILEIYLNVIEWGDGIYGAEAASRAYFGKGCGALLPEEGATLAAIVPNPRGRDPRRALSIVVKRKRAILGLMARRHYLSADEYHAAIARTVHTLPPPKGSAPTKGKEKPAQRARGDKVA